MDLQAWQHAGLDRHSVVADPKFKNAAKFNFRLAKDSPAFALGFKEFDYSDAGPAKLLAGAGRVLNTRCTSASCAATSKYSFLPDAVLDAPSNLISSRQQNAHTLFET